MPVVGFGGLMFRATDPAASKVWYREHLGVGGGCVPEGVEPVWQPGTGPAPGEQGHEYFWYPQAGPMVFEAFSEGNDYFASDKRVLINLRVRDMDGLVAQLGAAGIALVNDVVEEGVGRFVRINDPDGNPIELWEPPTD